jgi:flagellar hook-associated protein 1 FlgK
MSAHRTALDVTAHNVANASTAGYSRQQAVFKTTAPFGVASANRLGSAGQIGTGVQIAEITRVRDSYLDYQLRPQLAKMGYWEERYDNLSLVETVMLEPSDTSLSRVFDRFWSSWQELSKNPTSGAVRASVVESSATLAQSLNSVAVQLDTIESDINAKVRIVVNDINSLATQVAELNKQIVTNRGAGLNPNDLMDKRDMLLDELSTITEFTPMYQPNGSIDISINGRYLVQESRATEITTKMDAGGKLVASWADGTELQMKTGSLKGLYDVREYISGEFYSKLNTMAVELMTAVNTLHGQGRPLEDDPLNEGQNFFVLGNLANGDPAYTLRYIMVNPHIAENIGMIRAGEDGAGDGDGTNALGIARLRSALSENLGDVSVESFYSGIISGLGVETQQAERMAINQEALATQILHRREEVSGVSLDEEMANMLQFQHGFQAAARLLQTVDEILVTLINLGR